MKFMKFILSAPLQSWGEDARWDQRTTAAMPTKSAVVGLLGCCLGYPRGDERLNRLADQLRVAVRADRPGRVTTDYHTVQGTNGVFLNAEGKPRGGGGTIVTPKQYLQDARFTVFLWGEDEALSACYRASLALAKEQIRLAFEQAEKEVADLLGISQSYISRLEKRIILRPRRADPAPMGGSGFTGGGGAAILPRRKSPLPARGAGGNGRGAQRGPGRGPAHDHPPGCRPPGGPQ